MECKTVGLGVVREFAVPSKWGIETPREGLRLPMTVRASLKQCSAFELSWLPTKHDTPSLLRRITFSTIRSRVDILFYLLVAQIWNCGPLEETFKESDHFLVRPLCALPSSWILLEIPFACTPDIQFYVVVTILMYCAFLRILDFLVANKSDISISLSGHERLTVENLHFLVMFLEDTKILWFIDLEYWVNFTACTLMTDFNRKPWVTTTVRIYWWTLKVRRN